MRPSRGGHAHAIEGRYHALIARSAMTLRSEDGLAGVRGAIDIIVPMAQDTMAIRFGIMARPRPRAESAQRAG